MSTALKHTEAEYLEALSHVGQVATGQFLHRPHEVRCIIASLPNEPGIELSVTGKGENLHIAAHRCWEAVRRLPGNLQQLSEKVALDLG